MKIVDIIRNNTVTFLRYRKGFLYYAVPYEGDCYEFPVPIADTGDADFLNHDKAMLFMRYIRKAMDEGTLQKVVLD